MSFSKVPHKGISINVFFCLQRCTRLECCSPLCHYHGIHIDVFLHPPQHGLAYALECDLLFSREYYATIQSVVCNYLECTPLFTECTLLFTECTLLFMECTPLFMECNGIYIHVLKLEVVCIIDCIRCSR